MIAIHAVLSALTVLTAQPTPPAAAPAMEIVVNIPSGRLDVLQGGVRVRSYPVSVGTVAHTTPTGEGTVRRVVWNPSWTPPEAEWARNEKPKAPGWSNPMGRVKIHLFRDYYIHGTPAGNERRLGAPASHGCIRMANRDVMELAALVLRADGSTLSDADIQRIASNPAATRELGLNGRVQVRIEYRLAEVQGDSVTLHPDVYRVARGDYAARVRSEITSAGGDPAAIAHLNLAAAPAAPVRVARDSLPLPVVAPKLAAVTSLGAVALR
ncbi:MAG TPA: L,D-transpeptidase [Longimicrobiaceae bacterium]|nr:L,D-transpeptidase [Longimicrobiaceae bacterium]